MNFLFNGEAMLQKRQKIKTFVNCALLMSTELQNLIWTPRFVFMPDVLGSQMDPCHSKFRGHDRRCLILWTLVYGQHQPPGAPNKKLIFDGHATCDDLKTGKQPYIPARSSREISSRFQVNGFIHEYKGIRWTYIWDSLPSDTAETALYQRSKLPSVSFCADCSGSWKCSLDNKYTYQNPIQIRRQEQINCGQTRAS